MFISVLPSLDKYHTQALSLPQCQQSPYIVGMDAERPVDIALCDGSPPVSYSGLSIPSILLYDPQHYTRSEADFGRG